MKRLFASILSIVLVLSLLAGCGTGNTQETTAPASTPAEVEVTQAPAEPEKELGKLPLVEDGETVTLTIGIQQNPNVEDYDTNDLTVWLEEQTGIDLEFVMFSSDNTEAVQQLNAMIGGGEKLPDILYGINGVTDSLRNQLGEEGYFVDLKPMIEEYGYYFWEQYNKIADKFNYENEVKGVFTYGVDPGNGALYGMPYFGKGGIDKCATMAIINKTWLDAIGKDVPTTVEELEEVLKLFATEDPNGNGIADEIPYIGQINGYRADATEFLINAFVYCNDTYFWNVDDGKLWEPYTHDQYREALRYMNDLYEQNLFSPLTFSIASGSEMQALATPLTGDNTVGVCVFHPTLGLDVNSPYLFDYVPLNLLDDASGEGLGGYAPDNMDSYKWNTFITSDCADPVLAFKFLDFLSSDEAHLRTRYGVEGVHWRWATDEDPDDQYGSRPDYVLLEDVWSSQSNALWHTESGHLSSTTAPQDENADLTVPANFRKYVLNFPIGNEQTTKRKDETVHTLVYNTEENQYVTEVATTIQDYIEEQRALFIAGTVDIDDDAAWDNYLQTLEAMGLSRWQEIAQTAYDRMNAE